MVSGRALVSFVSGSVVACLVLCAVRPRGGMSGQGAATIRARTHFTRTGDEHH